MKLRRTFSISTLITYFGTAQKDTITFKFALKEENLKIFSQRNKNII